MHHLPCVVISWRWWRPVWWVRCWRCDYREGPFVSLADARTHEMALERNFKRWLQKLGGDDGL